ncbi:spore coat protein [Sporosarcina sp. P37]|uniref:spore coat protein n=1 Tax=unclassified Sporosarcina TaxID=2647733 RepID=UPI0009C27667|nr:MULTISPECIES: spore coat protein [unclassified Sporosarcina]ARD49606.1 spore gernimation protein GerQ [Sporosarcina sp. P33]ARK26164.1 spore coat protein [Sporosarcina sp. P37]PID17835.1 spore coat protein [Sporosarcina sp. P35]
MQGEQVPPSMNHGGHELFDVHEVLNAAVGALNQSMILRPHVQDPELLDILDRQYRFMLDEYNITVECFKSGKDPSHPTQRYQMKAGSDFVYGIKEKAPSKPIHSTSEITDEIISGFLLGAAKEGATGKTAASLEVCNPVVRRVLADSVANCIEMAYELAIYQNKHQYYQVPQLNTHDMQMLLNSFAPFQGQPAMPKNLQ